MKSKYILSAVILSLFLIQIMSVDAFFTKSHEYWILKTLEEEPDSMVATLCGDHPEWLTDSNTINDAMVIHYTDQNKVKSYIFLHQRNSFNKCIEEAGTDREKRCRCYGSGSHIIQDAPSHLIEGLVPTYLRKFFSSNLVGHMAIENDFDIKLMKKIQSDSIVKSGQLDYYDSIALNSFFNELGGNTDAMKIYARISGLSDEEFERDVKVFRTGYIGEGFFNSVYRQKAKLPSVFWIYSIGMLSIGLLLGLLFLFGFNLMGIQVTRWRFLLVLMYLTIAFIGIMLIISLYMGTTWEWVRMSLRVLPIRVSDGDVTLYSDNVLKSTKSFFRTGQMTIDDASGLSYYDGDGNLVAGELNKAELPFKLLLLLGVLPFFILINVVLLYKTFSKNKNSKLNKIMNLLGLLLLAIILFLIVADIVYILFLN